MASQQVKNLQTVCYKNQPPLMLSGSDTMVEEIDTRLRYQALDSLKCRVHRVQG
jgi:hypothetical protein